MNLYAEPSAILAWLLGEGRTEEARASLARATMVLSSEVTLVECDRVLLRAQAAGDLAAPALAVQRRRLRSACAHWTLFPLQAEIVERARQGFPHEPVRTLDAIHLATLVVARALVSDLHLLSFDERIILNARGMGFPVVA